jgi:hypothetical protein
MSVQCNGFIAEDAAGPDHIGSLNAPGVHVAFGAAHKLGFGMHWEQAIKAYVATAHDIERA